MNGLHRPSLLLLCVLLVAISGCTTTAIGDARYSNGEILVNLTSSSETADAWMQVTCYRIEDLHQTEVLVVDSPVSLKTGESKITLPAHLEAGSYKLYIYLIRNGERNTAVIRDIVV
jgi:hypothetical protein